MDENESNWGIVELMGHKVVAGRIQKSEMLGKPMLRVDIPQTSAYPEFTQFYGDSAIYCVTFTSKEVAKAAAESYKVNPVSVYVPDLVPVEKHAEIIEGIKKQYQARIDRLSRGLPAPEEDPDEWSDEEDMRQQYDDEVGF